MAGRPTSVAALWRVDVWDFGFLMGGWGRAGRGCGRDMVPGRVVGVAVVLAVAVRAIHSDGNSNGKI